MQPSPHVSGSAQKAADIRNTILTLAAEQGQEATAGEAARGRACVGQPRQRPPTQRSQEAGEFSGRLEQTQILGVANLEGEPRNSRHPRVKGIWNNPSPGGEMDKVPCP